MLLTLCSCLERKESSSHPWGDDLAEDSAARADGVVSLEQIISNGEILVATITGPDTYYDYHDLSVGTQYLLMKKFSDHIGVRVRIETCKDTLGVLEKLKSGSVDVAMLRLPDSKLGKDYLSCAKNEQQMGWFVNAQNGSLAKAINEWYKPEFLSTVVKEEQQILSGQVVIRHTYSYFLDRANGVISQYDELFKRYSAEAGVDWKLLASICYQESRFDPEARSFAGASGLMQLMPKTAESMGLPHEEIFNPEKNIATAARYISRLKGTFKDITNQEENLKFVLGGYNGGAGHIRDAMALARADGKNPQIWNNVAPYVLALSSPNVYNKPIVKYGYMRGIETVNYVSDIFNRWYDYRGVVGGPDIYNAGELSIEDIIGTSPVTNANVPPPPGSETAETGATGTTIDSKPMPSGGNADHSVPTPATTKRKAKYDLE